MNEEQIKSIVTDEASKQVIELMQRHELDVSDKNLVSAMIMAFQGGLTYAKAILKQTNKGTR